VAAKYNETFLNDNELEELWHNFAARYQLYLRNKAE
jgi:hypothetical protein